MLTFLPVFLRVPLAILLLVTNTVVHSTPLFMVAIIKFLVPLDGFRRFCSWVLVKLAEDWVLCNSGIFRLMTRIDWDVQGMEGLNHEGWYLVLSNHQSWVDIPVLQRTLHMRVPFLKFFLKQELIWVPVLGLAWWALDFPFMKRYTKDYLDKNPHLRGSDIAATRAACEKFRHVPVSVMNFVEGTRYTPAKHERQQSPYTHLLRPKSGGVAFVMETMGDILQSIVDVTIVYPQGRPTFMDMLSGRLRRVQVLVRQLPIPRDLVNGDYENDPVFRARFQQWINNLWAEKDALIARTLAAAH